jgi:hypothetical protein
MVTTTTPVIRIVTIRKIEVPSDPFKCCIVFSDVIRVETLIG